MASFAVGFEHLNLIDMDLSSIVGIALGVVGIV